MNDRFLVVGAGGHGGVAVSILQLLNLGPIAIVDDDPAKWGQKVLGEPVIGGLELIARFRWSGCVLAVGDNQRRRKLADQWALPYCTVAHPSAVVHESVRLGPGTLICAGAILQPGCVLGEHVIVNTGAIVDHDSRIGSYVHVAPGAKLTGEVEVEEGTTVGAGAVVAPRKHIGAWAVIGAGSVVVRDIPGEVIAFGVPARIQEPCHLEAHR